MTGEQALIAAVCAAPYDDAPRLAYAAWLEAQGPPRSLQGELIRCSLALSGKWFASLPTVDERVAFIQASDRVTALEREAGKRPPWAEAVLALVDECTVRHGMVAGVTLSAEAFIERAARLFHVAPIVHLVLTDVGERLEEALRVPGLERIRALTLAGQELKDRHLRDLAQLETLPNLWYLDLRDNEISEEGVVALAVSDHFPRLTHVVLDGNPGNVHERCGLEEAIVHVWFPPGGEAIEASYGRIPWLHFPKACWEVFPPDPCGPPLT